MANGYLNYNPTTTTKFIDEIESNTQDLQIYPAEQYMRVTVVKYRSTYPIKYDVTSCVLRVHAGRLFDCVITVSAVSDFDTG